jgi:O-antigen/teichoic acid export membrane protein
MARGAAWMILFKWTERGLGLLSTLVLVRLLSPEDFGMVAMAMSFILMAEMFSAFAFDIALIHDQKAGPDHYNSAWTAEILLGATIAIVMWVFAYPISLFYEQPDLVALIAVLALGPLANGLENIGVVAFRKDLEFHKEFAFQVSRKIISFIVVVPLAFWLRSYWALVGGIIASKAGASVLSYWAHPFRPKICFKELRSLLSFSKWLLLNNIVNFLKERSTDFFVGKIQGPATLGLFNVSYEFANLPTTEIGMPVNRALLPGFAKLGNEPDGIRQTMRNAVGLVALIAVPTGLGLFSVAPYFVPVVLGEKWLPSVAVMELLSINSSILVFHGTIVTLFIALGRPYIATMINLFFVVVLVSGLVMLVGDQGAVGAAWSMLIACIVSTPVYLLQAKRHCGVPFSTFIAGAYRPVLAGLAMIVAVRSFLPAYEVGMPIGQSGATLAAAVAIGASAYAAAIGAIWAITGFPDGAEKMVLSKVRSRLGF